MAVVITAALGVSAGASVAATSDPAPAAPAGVDAQTADEQYGVGPKIDFDSTPSTGLAGGSSGGFGTLAASFSPAGCVGKTDYPHLSGSEASVHGRTKCDYIVSTVTVSTTLQRQRWYGLETLDARYQGRNDSNASGNATPHWVCVGTGLYSYFGVSTHTSLEGGKTYTAATSGYYEPASRFNC